MGLFGGRGALRTSQAGIRFGVSKIRELDGGVLAYFVANGH